MTTYHERRCNWCYEPMRRDEPTAYLTDGREQRHVHVACGRVWIANKRDILIDNCRENDRLALEVRSLRIVPAQETADDDGLRVVDGVCVGGWAH